MIHEFLNRILKLSLVNCDTSITQLILCSGLLLIIAILLIFSISSFSSESLSLGCSVEKMGELSEIWTSQSPIFFELSQ